MYKRITMFLLLFICFMTVSAQTKFFDPDGYYFPTNEKIIFGLKIDNISISTLDYYNNGKSDYDNPKMLKPTITVSFLNSNKYISSSNIIVKRDTLFFRFVISKSKTVEFHGNFIDKRGQYWNQNDVIPQETVILKGNFILFENGMKKANQEYNFTYWEGD